MTLSCTPLTHHLLHVQCPPSPPPSPPPHTPATSATTHLPTVKPARTQFSSLEPAAITASAAADDAVAVASCRCCCCCRYPVSLSDSSVHHHHHNHQQLIPQPHQQQYNNCQHHHRQQEQRHRQHQQNDQVLHEQYLHQRHQSSRKDNQCKNCEHYRNSRNCSSSNYRRHWECSGGVESSCSNGPFSTAAAAAAVVTSKTLRWCRTLLIFPALSLLLLLRLRRKGRRHRTSQVPHVLLSVSLLLTMLTGRSMASPWIEESPNSVKLRAQFCQPVPEQHLRGMLGTSFDSSRMTNEDPRAGKRGDPGLDPALEEAALDSYYMEDDPRTGGYMDEDFVDIVTDEGGEGEEWFRREEVEVTEGEGGELEVEEKDFEEEEEGEAGYYRKKDSGTSPLSRRRPEPRERKPDRGQLYPYMKRRKRRSAGRRDRERGYFYPASGAAATPTPTTTRTSRRAEDGSYSYSSSSSSSSSSVAPNKDKKSKDSLLPLRLLLSGKNRKLRRKLKKVFRKKARKLSKKPPPWTCNMTKVWGRLKDGYFPRYMLDGRCLTDKCFYRLYNCVPQKYRVKVLKRDPDYCNPLPTIGLNSTYEQKWSVVRYYATVGCNCKAEDPLQRPDPSSSSSSSSSRRRKP